MSEPNMEARRDYRGEIARDLTPVRPLSPPVQRVLMLTPLILLFAVAGPLVNGRRGDLVAWAPWITWGVTALQAVFGAGVLVLAFREAIPGRNVSVRSLALVGGSALALVTVITLLTDVASATEVPTGRALRYWVECVIGPMAIGMPFMLVATWMALRAFATRPAIAGALCGLSAGILADAGWRLSCWISDPAHALSSHGLAIVGLAATGSLVAVLIDRVRWVRLRA